MKVCISERWERDGCYYDLDIHKYKFSEKDFIFDVPEATVRKWRNIIARKRKADHQYFWHVCPKLGDLYENRERNNNARPISVACPNCNKTFKTTDGELPDEHEGFGVSCPWCNQVVYKIKDDYAIRTTGYGWVMINRNLNRESSLDKQIRLAGIGRDKPKAGDDP